VHAFPSTHAPRVRSGPFRGSPPARSLPAVQTRPARPKPTCRSAGDEVVVRSGDLAHVWLDVTAAWGYAVPARKDPKTVVVDVLAGASSDD